MPMRRKPTKRPLRPRLASEFASLLVTTWAADGEGTIRFPPRWGAALGLAQLPSRMPLAEFLELMHPEDRAPMRSALAAALKGDAPLFGGEYRLRRGDGRWAWIRAQGRVTERDPRTGRVRAMQGIAVEVSESRFWRERYRALVEHAAEAVFYFEHDPPVPTALPEDEQVERILASARLAEANRAHARLYGYAPEGPWRGRPLESFGGREANVRIAREFVRSGYRLVDHEWTELLHGEERFFRGSIVGVVEQGLLLGAWGTQRDRTAERRTRRLVELDRQILARSARGERVEAILEAMLSGAEALVPGLRAAFLLVDEARRITVSLGPSLPAEYHATLVGVQVGPRSGTCGAAIHHGERQITTDTETDERWEPWRALARRYALRACWSQPVRFTNGTVAGAFAFYRPAPGEPEGWVLEVLEKLGQTAALVLEARALAAALAESEGRFRDFARSAAEWMWETDAEGRFTWVSEERRRHPGALGPENVIGRTREELAGASAEELEGEPWLSHRLALAERRPFRDFRYCARSAAGGRWISASGVPYFRRDGRFAGYRGVAMDITQAVQAEERARAAEKLLREAIARLDVPITITDAEDRIVLANDGHRRMNPALPDGSLGLAYEEHLRRGIALGYYPQAVGREREWLAERMEARRRADGRPVEVARQDGRWYAVSYHRLATGGILTLSVDLTERKRAERALAESEERFRRFAELSSEALVLVGADLAVRYANPSAARLFGVRAPAELLGRRYDALFPEDARATVLGRVREVLAGRGAVPVSERRIRPLDGSAERVVEASGVYVPMPQGAAALALLRDVTERVRQREALERLNAQLERRVAERTAELEATNARLAALVRELEGFAYSVSHDLKSPIRAVAGFARLLAEEEGERLSAEGRRLLGVVEANAKRMDELTEGLLALSRVNRAELWRERIDLPQLATEAFASLGADAASVRFELTSDIPAAEGDPRLVRQLLANLIGNAVKYTARAAAPRVEFGWDEAERAYYVRDTGIGFDMRHAERLFRPFERLHVEDEYPGTGIGLALVARIVERHGGRVWAQAAPGAGATFWFTLPLAAED